MKAATKKIILTKDGKVSKSVINNLKNCLFNDEKRIIYTGYYSGSKRYTKACSAKIHVTQILKAEGYKFTEANDAARGGISGEHLKVSITALNFILNLRND